MTTRCSNCGVSVDTTPDLMLYKWPNGDWLCWDCNEQRKERLQHG